MSAPGRNFRSELLGAIAVVIMLGSAVALAGVLTRDSFAITGTEAPTAISLVPTEPPGTATLPPTTPPGATALPTAGPASGTPIPATATGTATTVPASPTPWPTATVLVPSATVVALVPSETATDLIATLPAVTVPSPQPSATLPAKPTLRPTRTPLPTPTNTPTEQPSPTATNTPTPTATPEPPRLLPTATSVPSATSTTIPTEMPPIVLATPVTPEVYACTPPPGWLPYTIRSGENLFRLSLRAGISLQEMQRVNCISNAANISTGNVLYVPPAFFARSPSSAGSTAGTTSGSSLPNRVGCTAPGSQITFPAAGAVITGRVNITGSATLGNRNNEFSFYKVELRGEGETGYRNLNQATTPVAAGLLAVLNTADFGPGNFQLRLTVVDITGNYIEPCTIRVTFR